MESAINNAEMPNPPEEREDLVLNEKRSSAHADINAFQNSYRTKYEENFDSAGCMDSDESDDDNSSASDAEDSTKNAEGKLKFQPSKTSALYHYLNDKVQEIINENANVKAASFQPWHPPAPDPMSIVSQNPEDWYVNNA